MAMGQALHPGMQQQQHQMLPQGSQLQGLPLLQGMPSGGQLLSHASGGQQMQVCFNVLQEGCHWMDGREGEGGGCVIYLQALPILNRCKVGSVTDGLMVA